MDTFLLLEHNHAVHQYQTFLFDSCDFDPETGRIGLRYSLDGDIRFEEVLEIPNAGLNLNAMHQALLALHIAGGVSYYKTCCPKKIEIRSGHLNLDQAKLWNAVYTNGLGEFFCKNKIDFRGLIGFPAADPGTPVFHQSDRAPSKRMLAGTSRARTMVASTITATAMPTPISFTSSMSALMKPTMTATKSRAARVMSWPVRSRPRATLKRVSPVWSYASRIWLSRNSS